MKTTTEVQRWLIREGYLAPVDDKGRPNDDGIFGTVSLAAYNRARAAKGLPPHQGLLTLVEINQVLFPEEQPKKLPSKPTLFENIGAILTILQLTKGKTMLTSDQITGVIRAILAAVSGYFIAKGVGNADVWNWIIAGVTGIVPVIWTWVNNRPKTIQPIGK